MIPSTVDGKDVPNFKCSFSNSPISQNVCSLFRKGSKWMGRWIMDLSWGPEKCCLGCQSAKPEHVYWRLTVSIFVVELPGDSQLPLSYLSSTFLLSFPYRAPIQLLPTIVHEGRAR
jgi:hypothetical protein